MPNLLYNENTVIGRLRLYFSMYFSTLPKPTAENLFMLLLAMIALESMDSIRFLFCHFISGLTKKTLNAYYRTLSVSKASFVPFMGITASLALKIIPEFLRSLPVFLCIDDTTVGKKGETFENVSVLFDHACHNGSRYLNGHCFVSMMLCVHVWKGSHYVYEGIPLGYRMWKKEETKLSIAADMVRNVMGSLVGVRHVILLADSWYGKSEIFSLSNEFENLDVTCNVRCDTVLYDVAPPRTGKRGRPPKHGQKLSITDISLKEEKAGDYFVGHRIVLTNLIKWQQFHAFVTSTKQDGGNRRLFLSTVDPTFIRVPCARSEKSPLKQCGREWMDYVPLFCYVFRWSIEIGYYEHKTFWSLCAYMVRHAPGIEMLVDLICVAHSAMKILPYIDPAFVQYKNESPQEFRFILSGKIREQVFLRRFAENAERHEKSKTILDAVKDWIFGATKAS